jgi:RNA polymerase sigma factor (sigma-70 family)
MDDEEWLAARFEASRPRLRAVAYRMLGSLAEAEDAVQEAWLHASGADSSQVANMEGWLTTITSRVCLDMLRSRKSRREEPLEGVIAPAATAGPEEEAILADSVGLAMLVVLDTLAPAERVAFVLHDMFGMPFDEIAAATGRSATAARQLASRARRRVRGPETMPAADLNRQRRAVEAYLAAVRHGDFEALVAVLDPDVVLRGDTLARFPGSPEFLRGAANVAKGAVMARKAAASSGVALINGVPGIVWAPRGHLTGVLTFTVAGEKITRIEIIQDPDSLGELEFAALAPGS